jgi:hypothetical protein
MAVAHTVYTGDAQYRSRIADRQIPIFMLESTR